MKNYLIQADVAEDMPTYTFIVEAMSTKEAHKKANEILETDYPFYRENKVVVQLIENIDSIINALKLY